MILVCDRAWHRRAFGDELGRDRQLRWCHQNECKRVLDENKMEKKKKDGKPEGQAIRGVAERVRWSRGKQWNSKQVRLWLQESAAEHHEHALRDLFPLGPFLIFTHLPLSVLKPDSIFYTKDTVSNYQLCKVDISKYFKIAGLMCDESSREEPENEKVPI